MVTTERVITDIKKLEPIEAMKEANKVLKGEGRYKNLSQADREKIVNDESVTDHIFERQKPRDADDPNYDAEQQILIQMQIMKHLQQVDVQVLAWDVEHS